MIEKNHFEMVLLTISAGLVKKIVLETGLDEDVAMEKLYSSALYAELEKEETKVWHYSVPKLFELLHKEMENGQLVLPEY